MLERNMTFDAIYLFIVTKMICGDKCAANNVTIKSVTSFVQSMLSYFMYEKSINLLTVLQRSVIVYSFIILHSLQGVLL